MKIKALILDNQAIKRAITRVAHEIIEKNKGAENLVLIGIKTGGWPLAKMIQEAVKSIENIEIPTFPIDITFYRDDFEKDKEAPISVEDFKYDIENKSVVLIDDVLYTGRTVRAALDAIVDKGRPKNVFLAVLIDRGHRELPIRADFIGKNVPTSREEKVKVYLDVDGESQVLIEEK